MRVMARTLAALLLFVGIVNVAPANGASIVVDHTNWNWYDSQSQKVFDKVGTLKVFFSHASVGDNIVGGLNTLHSSDAGKYQMVTVAEDGTAPAATEAGRFYQYSRGNPGWKPKMDLFNTYVTSGGWNSPKIDFAMDKLCFGDQGADVNYYISLMSTLMAGYSDTRFVFWTIPLVTSNGYDNVVRNMYNDALRNYAKSNDAILFDIADIEAWSPDGVHQTFDNNGAAYETLYLGYTSDGGHLNATGASRVALGIYSLLGLSTYVQTPVPAAAWLFGSGLLGLLGMRKRFFS